MHFSRAAARVHLAQQALSREIRELEGVLGTKLLTRTTRKVALTPAGEVFLAGAQAALASIDGAVAETRRMALRLAGTLRLGYPPGGALELTSLIVAEFERRSPGVSVEMREFPLSDPSAGLASGASDVAFLRLPLSTPDIDTETLFVDPVVAMVAATHRHAARTSVSAGDLLDDPITSNNTGDAAHRAFWRLDAARDNGSRTRVVPVGSITEEAQLVAAGAAIAITSSAVMQYLPVPGVRFLPIDDWPGSVIAVGWRIGGQTALVAQFVAAARSVRDRETQTVHRIENRLRTS